MAQSHMTFYHGRTVPSSRNDTFMLMLAFFLVACSWQKALAGQDVPSRPLEFPSLGQASHYYSTDMAVVSVRLRRADSGAAAEMKLPRAMIMAASGYSRRNHSSLPDHINVETLVLGITFPNGIPTSVAIRAYSKKEGIDESRAARTAGFFSRTTSTYIYVLEDGLPTATDVKKKLGISAHQESAQFPGAYHVVRSGDYILPRSDEASEFHWAECRHPVSPLNPCAYWFRVNEHLVAKSLFADLRADKGMEFANQRVRELRLTLCKFTTCGTVDGKGRLVGQNSVDQNSMSE